MKKKKRTGQERAANQRALEFADHTNYFSIRGAKITYKWSRSPSKSQNPRAE
jgi:hypothetical protein